MNIVFGECKKSPTLEWSWELTRNQGKLVTDFNGFFIPDSGVTKDQFLESINKNVFVT